MRGTLASTVLVAAALFATPAAAAPACGDRAATIVGTPRRDVLIGTAGNDVIVGGRGADTLIGFGGADRLCGGRGRDSLFGGFGGDMLAGGRGDDLLIGWLGNDFLDGGRGVDEVSFQFAQGVRVDLDAGRARGEGVDLLRRLERVTGSPGSDRLFGGPRADHLIGDRGDDIVRGRGGPDTIEGGRGDDTIAGGAAVDLVVFDAARAGVEATTTGATGEGTDGLEGVENLHGTRFGDRLSGDGGSNVLAGGSGYDRLFGGGGDDDLDGGLDGAEADGGDGADACTDTAPRSGCESIGFSARAPHAEVSIPWPGALLLPGDLERIRGRLLGDISAVRIAIRFLAANGCGWWVRGRLVEGGCASPRYHTPTVNRSDATFTFRFRHRVPAGRYLVRVEVRRGSGGFSFADAVSFQII